MQPLGRYRSRYKNSEFLIDPPPLHQTGSIGPDSHLIDIACADFDTVKVQCWPGTESCPDARRRRWGRRSDNNAVILPFRLRAGQYSTCKVKTVKLKLLFPSTIHPLQRTSAMPETVLGSPSEVHLIELPVPDVIKGPLEPNREPWVFRSESITESNGCARGEARGAMWTWYANDHDPCVLHGAVVVQHPNNNFLVECSVSGKASKAGGKENPRIRKRFRFESAPRHWYFNPQTPEADLIQFERAIQELDTRIKLLNTDSINYINAPAAALSTLSSQLPPRDDSNVTTTTQNASNPPAGRSYGNSVFLGTSTVHMGDATHNFHLTIERGA